MRRGNGGWESMMFERGYPKFSCFLQMIMRIRGVVFYSLSQVESIE